MMPARPSAHPVPGPRAAWAGPLGPATDSALLALGALLLLGGWLLALGAAPLFDVDEGAFAQASREMLASGDWGHTTLNGADRFDKPILVYWLQAISLALLGPDELAVRLPSALCAWAGCLAAAAFVAPRWGRRAALGAAVVLASSLGPLLIGRAATADALLNLLLALTLFDLWRHLESGHATPWRRAALWAGLGLLAKGPVALVLPAGALLLWATIEGRPAWRRLGSALRDGRAWLICAAVALPWYAYALQRHGWAFVEGFLLRHNLQRYGGTLEGHGGSTLYYGLLLPLLLLPWTPLLPALARQWRTAWAEPLSRWLLAWALFVLLFFSLSGTKLPHYGLYALTPLALLLGRTLWHCGRATLAAVLACAALLVAAGAASPTLLAAAARRWGDGHWRQWLAAADLPAGPDARLPLLAVAAAALLMAWRPRRAASATLAAALCTSLWCSALLVPWWGQVLQGPVKALAQQAARLDAPLVQWQLHQPSAAFYRGQPAPRRAPRPGELALVRLDRLPADSTGLQVLQQQRGLALVRALPVAAAGLGP